MTGEDKCPRCNGPEGLLLITVAEDGEDWELDTDPDAWEEGEDAEVWVCQNYVGIHLCGWHQEATPEEALEEHTRELEWLSQRLEQARQAKP